MVPDNDLINKFHNNNLSTTELKQLRDQVNHMSDDEIELQLLDSRSVQHMIRMNPEEHENLRERLVAEARKSNMRYRTMKRINIAAAAAVALLIGLSVILTLKLSHINRYENIIAQENTVTTGIGEELVALLPDGSRVKMAPESELKYSLNTFNDHERHIEWCGDGTFEIAHNQRSSFTVHANGFNVTVLGTVFSIDTRYDSNNSSIYLSSGSISLSVDGKDTTHTLVPGDLATINRTTGRISITAAPDYRTNSDDNMINFYNTSLRDVLTRLTYYYPEHITAPDAVLDAPFTGALPKKNIYEAVTILEKVYGMSSSKNNATGSIQLSL